MGTCYKLVARLTDFEHGELIAQANVIPLDWICPKIWRESSDVVGERADLSLNEASPAVDGRELAGCHGDPGVCVPPAGSYELAIDRHIVPKAIRAR
jgi:hypothetical protein